MSEMIQVPEGWEVIQLSDIGEVITGNTPSTDHEEYYGGSIPFIGPVDFQGQKYITNSEKKVTSAGLLQSRKIPSNSIMTVCIGSTIGKIAISTSESCTNQQVNSLQCSESFNPEFIYYSMNQFLQKQLEVEAGLQAVPIVNKSVFSRLFLLSPISKVEQHRIAEILSTLDRTIEASEKLIAKEKQIKKGLMNDLLTHGIDEAGRIRTPQTHRYQESELGMIPEGWVSQTFKQASIELIDGDRGTNYPKDDDFFEHGYCLFLSAKNVTKTGFKFGITQFISKEKDAKLSKGKLSKNDIVLTTRGTVGNVAYYSSDIHYDNIRINSGMIILRNKNSNLLTSFLYLLLRSGMFMRQLEVTVFGSAQPQLTVKEIQKFIVKIPSLSEQKHITHIITVQDKKIENEEANLAKLKELKKGLMDDLLSGRVRVKE